MFNTAHVYHIPSLYEIENFISDSKNIFRGKKNLTKNQEFLIFEKFSKNEIFRENIINEDFQNLATGVIQMDNPVPNAWRGDTFTTRLRWKRRELDLGMKSTPAWLVGFIMQGSPESEIPP